MSLSVKNFTTLMISINLQKNHRGDNRENKNKAKTKLRSSFNNTSHTHVQRTSTETCMVLTNLQQRVQACRSNISDPKFWLYPPWRHFSSKVYHSWETESQHSQHTKQISKIHWLRSKTGAHSSVKMVSNTRQLLWSSKPLQVQLQT